MTQTTQNFELISALADGQLASQDFAAVLAICGSDEQALASWNAYHLIGDVLRSPGLASQASEARFLHRLRASLADEPAMDTRAGVASLSAVVLANPFVAGQVTGSEASNDSSFRWKIVAGFVSIAAVVAVAWNTGSGLLTPSVSPQLAQSAAPPPAGPDTAQQVLVMSAQGPVVRDARLQELLTEHKQFGGTSALQMPSGFLRNATFEGPQGARR